jgi:hypothetical protein
VQFDVAAERANHEAQAELIRAQWTELGERLPELRDTLAALRKRAGDTPEADFVGLVDSQLDQVGLRSIDPEYELAQEDAFVRTLEADAAGHVDDDFVQAAKETLDDVRAWQSVRAEAERVGDVHMQEVARARLVAAQLGRQADNARISAGKWEALLEKAQGDLAYAEGIQHVIADGTLNWSGYRSIAPGIATPNDIAEMLLKVERLVYSSDFATKHMPTWNKVVRWLKVWQIAKPGFHIRNLFGGMFNNALAEIDNASYARFGKAWLKVKAGKTLNAEEQRIWSELTSILDPGQVVTESGLGSPTAKLAGKSKTAKVLPSTNNWWVKASAKVGGDVEFFLRGALGWDTLAKGGSVDDAVSMIHKFHFNYEDLSVIDQRIKTVIPFYTWTRHNIPLQVEQLVTNPKMYARFAQAKAEIERMSDSDPIVPGYFAENLAIRLPWKTGDGAGHNYLIPDLPLRDLNTAAVPLEAAFGDSGDFGERLRRVGEIPFTMATPLITGPLEMMTGKQFYKDIPLNNDRPVALDELGFPDWVSNSLRGTQWVDYNKKTGRYYMTERDAYVVDKMLPNLAPIRRGLSNEQKMKDRRMGFLFSYFLGGQIRPNDRDSQEIANYLESLANKRERSITKRLGG